MLLGCREERQNVEILGNVRRFDIESDTITEPSAHNTYSEQHYEEIENHFTGKDKKTYRMGYPP